MRPGGMASSLTRAGRCLRAAVIRASRIQRRVALARTRSDAGLQVAFAQLGQVQAIHMAAEEGEVVQAQMPHGQGVGGRDEGGRGGHADRSGQKIQEIHDSVIILLIKLYTSQKRRGRGRTNPENPPSRRPRTRSAGGRCADRTRNGGGRRRCLAGRSVPTQRVRSVP
jgi:hypothetical protein